MHINKSFSCLNNFEIKKIIVVYFTMYGHVRDKDKFIFFTQFFKTVYLIIKNKIFYFKICKDQTSLANPIQQSFSIPPWYVCGHFILVWRIIQVGEFVCWITYTSPLYLMVPHEKGTIDFRNKMGGTFESHFSIFRRHFILLC